MDLEEFEGLIDDYQLAQESGKYKARVDARIALKDAWRGLEAERDALRKERDVLRNAMEQLAAVPGCGCAFPCRCGGAEWTRAELEGRMDVAAEALAAIAAKGAQS